MCKGKCVYNGSPLSIIPHFKKCGYLCEEHDNPADFALDVLISAGEESDAVNNLHKSYVESDMHKNINSFFTQSNRDDGFQALRLHEKGAPGRSFGVEIYYVSRRTLKNSIRNPALFLSQIVVSIVLGLLVGLVFNNIDNTVDPGIQDRLGAIFFIIVSQIFSTVTALEPFLKERVLFIHVSILDLYHQIIVCFLGKYQWVLSNNYIFHW